MIGTEKAFDRKMRKINEEEISLKDSRAYTSELKESINIILESGSLTIGKAC